MLAWKIAPALATGNTVVLKPAEFTSLTALRFAELCAEIDLPPGVVNIVTGDGRTGAAVVAHPDIDKIAFTGSTEVGRSIREATAGTGKKISLELGGKSPFVVFDDADLDSVVEGVVDAIWFNQGQVCCAGSRILAHEGIADALAERLRARMETLRIGDPLDKGIDIGAIIAPVQLRKIEALVEEGREAGATIWQPSWSVPRNGWFYPPTLCTDVSPAATIAQVEIFGPVVVQMTFRTPAEAVALANNTRYGLAASVWTENVNLALDIASQVKAGTVWINCTNVFDAASGFGGYRESGFGREGGREGLWEYVRRRPEVAGLPPEPPAAAASGSPAAESLDPSVAPPIDRTAKLYIGGRQTRPDGGYSLTARDHKGRAAGEVARANRKDVRNAVEAALGSTWARTTAHLRAQILYYLAENLAARRAAFEDRLRALVGCGPEEAAREVEASVRRLFTYAAWADKWDGAVHRTPFRNVTLAIPEPLGVMAVVCPPEPALLGLISTVIPPVALGNTVVAVASERWPLLATDFYQVLDTSDVPPGTLNLLTGTEEELRPVLAEHDAIDGMWHFGSDEGAAGRRTPLRLQPQADLGGRVAGARLVRPRRRGPRFPPPRLAAEEHLAPLRRMTKGWIPVFCAFTMAEPAAALGQVPQWTLERVVTMGDALDAEAGFSSVGTVIVDGERILVEESREHRIRVFFGRRHASGFHRRSGTGAWRVRVAGRHGSPPGDALGRR